MKHLNNKRKKQILVFLLAAIMLAASFATSIIAATRVYAASTAVDDEAMILDDYEIEDLTEQVQEASEETGWNIILGTTDDTDGRSAIQYSDDLYDQTFGINTDGIAIVIDLDNRKVWVSTSGDAIRTLNADRIETVLDAGYEDLVDGYYAESFSAMLNRAVLYKVNEKPHLAAGDFALAGIIAAAVFFVVIGITAGRYRLKWGTYSYDYHKEGKVKLTKQEDQFVNEVVTHHRIQTESHGGGGGTHMSSGGGMHGGGGRSF